MTSPLRIAWLTTGRGPGSYGALEYLFAAIDRDLPVEMAVVFVNRDPGEAEATDRLMDLVRARGVPLETLSSVRFRKERGGKLSRPGEPLQPWRLEYDGAVAERLGAYAFELGVMFGYMLIATPPLQARFTFINDHPALPDGPIGTYQEVIAELIRTGAAESGCMMNVVTPEVDRGPAVSFCRYRIRDAGNEELWAAAAGTNTWLSIQELQETPLYQDIRARGVRRERPFLVETLRAIASGRLALAPAEPLDLTLPVENAVQAEAPA
ncbi:MAG TPA: formyltransferase family protein [Tepidiformaceae bacterium]|nr:formyltransferase family protein [Tepidiformaceae bacterium]